MRFITNWLDSRTGYRHLLQELLCENIPGGSRWRYVWGSTLTFALAVQFVTGLFLLTAYSPSAQSAWESVYTIQYELMGGWLLRGIHHYTAQLMTVLLVLHLMQVLIDGAYKAPREVNFWFGLLLLLLVLALSLTGYLLPWDQKGYWATKVATNIAAITPVIGPDIQRLIVGGSDYGHHTLTRFLALHAGVLPAAVVVLVAGHIYLFRRHGITPKRPFKRSDAAFWPDQVLKDVVACLAVLATVMILILVTGGADLGPPANPAEAYDAARPDWYFLFLFEFLKESEVWFANLPGGSELWGAIIIPGALVGVVFLMPLLGRWRLGHGFNVGFMFIFIAAFSWLTFRAVKADRDNEDYQKAVAMSHREAERVRVLAASPTGIPPTGAVTLLRNDPLTQGPRIFAAKCASCHRHDGLDGMGNPVDEAPSAADLNQFASRAWLAGLLDPERVDSVHYFGGTAFAEGKMVKWVKRKVPEMSPEEKDQLNLALMALSAEAKLPYQREADARDAAKIKEGLRLLDEELACLDCHEFHFTDEDASGPDLTGYGSREWLIALVTDPRHERFYGERNDRMPAFGAEDILDDKSIGLVVDWLRGEWYRPESESDENH